MGTLRFGAVITPMLRDHPASPCVIVGETMTKGHGSWPTLSFPRQSWTTQQNMPHSKSSGRQLNSPSGGESQGSPTHNTQTIETNERPIGGVYGLADKELPHRFKQSTFDQYEPFIARAVKTGEIVEINPAPLRATTFAARARDAITAKRRFNWPATFTTAELDDSNITVRHGEHTVQIGPKQLRKARSVGEALAFVNPDHKRLGGIVVDVPLDRESLVAFAHLLAKKLLAGPLIIKSDVSPVDLDYLETTYDVAVMPVNAKGEVVIL